MTEEILEGGLIEEQVHESDRRFGATLDRGDIALPTYRFGDKRIQYDQRKDKDRPNGCTVFMAMGMYSDLTGYIFTEDEQREIYDLAVEAGLNPAKGWYLHKAVDLVRRYTRDREDLVSVSSARVLLGGNDYDQAMAMGFSVGTGYGGNGTYNSDVRDDAILQINTWGAATYHHAIRHAIIDNAAMTPGVVDNYVKTRPDSNVYGNPDIDAKIAESGEYFTWGYFYFTELPLPPPSLLPKHITRDMVPTERQAQAIIARENEGQKWLESGKKLLFTDYWSDDERDYDLMLSKMMDDLQYIRPQQLLD